MSTSAKYYDAHEAEYVRRLGNGHVGWDAGSYDEFFMRPFVTHCLERANFDPTGSCALDIGCGTGALSCQLAQVGFDVVGIDISPSAIAFARKMASARGLPITFKVADLCTYSLDVDRFDLIIDGHLLHCIVFEHERHNLLVKLRRSLRLGGEFWIETMLQWPGQPLSPTWHMDQQGIVWSQLPEGFSCQEAVWRENRWWIPQRLIAPSEACVIAELTHAGFRVIESEPYAPLQEGVPGGLRVRCIAGDID
jgi:SAM-dependent methyltransferase